MPALSPYFVKTAISLSSNYAHFLGTRSKTRAALGHSRSRSCYRHLCNLSANMRPKPHYQLRINAFEPAFTLRRLSAISATDIAHIRSSTRLHCRVRPFGTNGRLIAQRLQFGGLCRSYFAAVNQPLSAQTVVNTAAVIAHVAFSYYSFGPALTT